MIDRLKDIFKRNIEDGWTTDDLIIEFFGVTKDEKIFNSKRVIMRKNLKNLVNDGYIYEGEPRGRIWYNSKKVYKLKK